MTEPRLSITPLGGVGRFGGNSMLFALEGGPAFVVDCGVRFLDPAEAPGFEFGLCDVEAVAEVGEDLAAYVLTHGHEDHVGALPYAYERQPAPIVGTPFTLHRARKAFARAGGPAPEDHFVVVEPGGEHALGEVTVRWLAVSHSIPGSTALEIETPAGRVVHSGDFRVDLDPLVGPPTDLEGLAAVGERGVDLLVADSTSALVPGSSPGERSVVEPIHEVVAAAAGRVLITTFGSHVQRVAACAEVCRRTGRKMVLGGLSLKESVRAARELGLLPLEDVLLGESDARSVAPGRLLMVAAGCQADPGGTFDRISRGEHRHLGLEPGDTLIFSARVIPGNERAVAGALDRLAGRGVEIFDGRAGRHTSGHGSAGDLEALLAATRPRRFAAIHGGGRQLAAHRQLAYGVGLAPGDVLDLVDGMTVTLAEGELSVEPGPRLREKWIEGRHVVDDPEAVAGPRRRMGRAGVIVLRHDEGGRVRATARGVGHGVEESLGKLEGEATAALERAGSGKGRRRTDKERTEAATKRVVGWLRRRYRTAPEVIWLR